MAATTLASPSAHAAPLVDTEGALRRGTTPGEQLWVQRFNGTGNLDDAGKSVAVSPDGSRVFVGGYSYGATTEADYATFAYDTHTGAELWASFYDYANSYDYGTDLAVSPGGSLVFITGSGSAGITTVAYDATTGSQQWVAHYEADQPTAIAVSPDGSSVFVEGDVGRAHGLDFVTIAYDATSGARRWAVRYDGPAHRDDLPHGLAVSPDGSRVFVTGSSTHAGSNCGLFGISCYDFLTVSYDTSTGAKVWATRWNGPTDGGDTANAIAISPGGSKVFVTGTTDSFSHGWPDMATVGYDASTGAQLWGVRYNDPDDNIDEPEGIAVSPGGSKVVVTGLSFQGQSRFDDYATVAYDAASGAQLWASRYNGLVNAADDHAIAVVVSPGGSKIYVTGTSEGPNYGDDYATVAYDAATGGQQWVSRYEGPGSPPYDRDVAWAIAISPDGSRVFVTGESENGTSSTDIATVAYSAS